MFIYYDRIIILTSMHFWVDTMKRRVRMDQQEEVYSKPFEYTLSLVGGKWKMHILFWLWHRKVMRYSEIKRVLKNITHKMLSNQLKELQADGLIIRKEYPQVHLRWNTDLRIRETPLCQC